MREVGMAEKMILPYFCRYATVTDNNSIFTMPDKSVLGNYNMLFPQKSCLFAKFSGIGFADDLFRLSSLGHQNERSRGL